MSIYRSNGNAHLLILSYYLIATLLYSLPSLNCVDSPVIVVGSASSVELVGLQARFPGFTHSFISCQLLVMVDH